MFFSARAGLVSVLLIAAFSAGAAMARDGVQIGNPSFLRKLYSAEKLENTAALQYEDMTRQVAAKGALAGPRDPQVIRLKRILGELVPYTYAFNERAKDWNWQVELIKSPEINAFCMPGGKIAFYSGILDKLQLTDDEVVLIMGHEIAHALREHARERAAKSTLTGIGALAVGVLVGGNVGEVARVGGGLMNLKFSRDDEGESDLIGMELAARAGYDPRAGISLWKKMALAAKRTPPQWLSTHPSSAARITRMEAAMGDVMPIYERAKAKRN